LCSAQELSRFGKFLCKVCHRHPLSRRYDSPRSDREPICSGASVHGKGIVHVEAPVRAARCPARSREKRPGTASS
jgi:hypothetical protein